MNNKTYANYLMHGRTKGSRNGISTTKGYTAVGQKAKGHLVNGKYVYDYASTGSQNDWQQQGNYARAGGEAVNRAVSGQTSRVHIKLNSAQENQGIAGMTAKNIRDLSKAGATKGDAQQAALEQWKKQNQNAIAAKKKKAEAFDKASDAYRLGLSYPVDQMANRTRTLNEHYNKNWKNNTTIDYDAPGAKLDAQKGKEAAYLRGKNAVNKATMNGTNTNASQQAELERWKQQNRNNIAASKKAALEKELRINAALNKYTTKDWQNRANIARANTEVRNKVVSGESNKGYTPYAEPGRVSNGIADEKTRNLIRLKNLQNRVYAEQNKKAQEATEKAKQSASYNKMSSPQKNAMQNDPRYSKDSLVRVKNFNPTHTKNNVPYFNQISDATNKQEYSNAVAKNKQYINDLKESRLRNSRSDIGNALADAKEDAKNAFKALKNKFKKKKKK